MIRFAIRALCLLACLAAAHGQRVADFSAALDRAKSSKSMIAVLVRGSDWNRPGEVAAKIWNDPRFLSSLGSGVLLLEIDRKENPTEADLVLAKLNEKADPPSRSIPAIAFYDGEGRLIGAYSGMAEIEGAGGLLPATKKLLAVARERDRFWKSATGSSGMMKAGRLGQGLDCMDFGLGPKGIYNPILEEMKKCDPEDKSGYIAKYGFSSEKLVSMALDRAEKKEFADAEREFAEWEANPRLSTKQKQQLQAARFALYQRWPEMKGSMKPLLKKMRDIDPKSELGQAAANYLDLLDSKRQPGDDQA